MYICIHVYIYAYAHMYIYISTTRACAPVQRCSSFLAMEAIANLSWVLREHRAGCRFRPPSCPFVEPAALLLARSQTCSLKKSDQICASSWRGRRCSVAQASSDHPRWCGPHPVCLWFTLALGHRAHPRQTSIFAIGFAGFSIRVYMGNTAWNNLKAHLYKYIENTIEMLGYKIKIKFRHIQYLWSDRYRCIWYIDTYDFRWLTVDKLDTRWNSKKLFVCYVTVFAIYTCLCM